MKLDVDVIMQVPEFKAHAEGNWDRDEQEKIIQWATLAAKIVGELSTFAEFNKDSQFGSVLDSVKVANNQLDVIKQNGWDWIEDDHD
jgi:hypothetical protein